MARAILALHAMCPRLGEGATNVALAIGSNSQTMTADDRCGAVASQSAIQRSA